MAMFSFSFKFRPRTIAGAKAAPTAVPATVRPNWRRVGRPIEEEEEVLLMVVVPLVSTLDRSVRPLQQQPVAPAGLL
jgi:hypothetical protein